MFLFKDKDDSKKQSDDNECTCNKKSNIQPWLNNKKKSKDESEYDGSIGGFKDNWD